MDEEILEKIYTKILNFIAYKQRTEKEVTDRLYRYILESKSPLNQDDAESLRRVLLGRIAELGLINDERYIRDFLQSSKPKSKITIRQKLLKKGISREKIDMALRSLDTEYELKSASKDAQKKVRALTGLDRRTKQQKLKNYLFRKGYRFEVINSVVDSVLRVK